METRLPNNISVLIIICSSLVCLCLVLLFFQNVKSNSLQSCPAGCGKMVKDKYEDRKKCENCGLFVWGCIATYPSATKFDPLEYHINPSCNKCGKRHYLCVPLEQQSAHKHRIIGRGTPHERYVCGEPEDPPSVPIPDR